MEKEQCFARECGVFSVLFETSSLLSMAIARPGASWLLLGAPLAHDTMISASILLLQAYTIWRWRDLYIE